MTTTQNKGRALGMLLWSVALPGFGQLLNHKYVKGVILIAFEIAVNIMGNLNQAIILSFHGKIQEAIELTNYNWLMFYPCLYFFAIWDAYHDGGGGKGRFAYLPFAAAAYIVTIALIFSPVFAIGEIKFGPVWLPILSMPIGLGVGALVRWVLLKANA